MEASEVMIEEALAENNVNISKTVIQEYLEILPQKALNLGVRVVLIILFLFIGIYLINILRKIIKTAMKKTNIDPGVIGFVDSCMKFVLYAVLILLVAVNNGFDAASIVAVLGSGCLTLGLAMQGALTNFTGGLLILILKPFKVGDYIIEDSKGNEGTVTEISVFYTSLHTVENQVVKVPNGVLANCSLTNVTAMKDRQFDLRIPVSYQSDVKEVKEILQDILENDPGINHDAVCKVFLREFGDSALIMGIRAWVKTESYWDTRWRIMETIKAKFDENHVEIPFNQIDVWMKDKEKELEK